MTDHFQLALAAQKAGDFDVAERHYQALPTLKNAQHNLGVLYRITGRYEQAEAIFRRILATFPNEAHARHSLAHTLLALEKFAEAWPLWEARRNVGHGAIFEPVVAYPEWQGEPVRGKRVVVCAEHGLGDQVLFGRYLPLLRDAGAEVTVACNLIAVGRLFEHAGFATSHFTSIRRTLPAADYWVFVGSLPLRLGAPEPAPADYLRFPPASGGGLGVMAQGYKGYAYDGYRSMPDEAAAELVALGRSLVPADTGAQDVLETAQIIAGLDRVVSTDTLAPNLAGSMGKPITVLLSQVAACWRWGAADRSPWFPQARVYRQPTLGDWGSLIAQVRRDLAAD